VGLMLPHRTTIYTIRWNAPSTQRNHSFPPLLGVNYTCRKLANASETQWKRGRDAEKLENKADPFGRKNS